MSGHWLGYPSELMLRRGVGLKAFGIMVGMASPGWTFPWAIQGTPLLQGLQAKERGTVARSSTSVVHRDCKVCHTPHNVAKGAVALQRSAAKGVAALQVSPADSLCLPCHQSPAAALRREGPAGLPIVPGGSSHGLRGPEARGASYVRVVRDGPRRLLLKMDCTGCHDPHGKSVGKLKILAFDTRGQLLAGVKPVAIAQLCFGCHAGTEATPLTGSDPDVGLLFSKGILSSHVIGHQASDRPDLPSLRAGEFRGPLDCTSCHANPDPTGLRGPHVSSFPSLLKAAYGRERDAGLMGGRANDLCFTCHDKNSIETNRSFPFHREHLYGFTGSRASGGRKGEGAARPEERLPFGFRTGREAQSGRAPVLFAGFGEPTPCATCHDPHGSKKNPSLIKFDPSVVTRSSVGGVDYYRSGLGHGTCTLTCHGSDHVQTRY